MAIVIASLGLQIHRVEHDERVVIIKFSFDRRQTVIVLSRKTYLAGHPSAKSVLAILVSGSNISTILPA